MMRLRVSILLFLLALFIPIFASAGSVTAGSVNGTSGSTTLVPILLAEADPMYRLDLTLSYDPKICTAVDVLPGDFTINTTLTSALDRGEIRAALVSPDGIGGDGVLAWIRFRVLASSGSSNIRVLSARSTTSLEKRDGTLAILPGISFSRTAEGRQRITVELKGSAASISGDTISFSDGEMQILVRTEGIGASSTLASGLVHNVTMISAPASVVLPSGGAGGSFAFTFPEYPSEGSLLLALSPTPASSFHETILRAANASHLNVSAVSLAANPSVHGVSFTGPVMLSFTLPSALTPGSNETFRLASREENGAVSLSELSFTDSGEDTLNLMVKLPRFPSELAILMVKEDSRPALVTPGYTSGSILSSGTESAGGTIWVGMIMMFFLVGAVVIAVFYVHRKRGG